MRKLSFGVIMIMCFSFPAHSLPSQAEDQDLGEVLLARSMAAVAARARICGADAELAHSLMVRAANRAHKRLAKVPLDEITRIQIDEFNKIIDDYRDKHVEIDCKRSLNEFQQYDKNIIN
jgi:hypothetical protein